MVTETQLRVLRFLAQFDQLSEADFITHRAHVRRADLARSVKNGWVQTVMGTDLLALWYLLPAGLEALVENDPLAEVSDWRKLYRSSRRPQTTFWFSHTRASYYADSVLENNEDRVGFGYNSHKSGVTMRWVDGTDKFPIMDCPLYAFGVLYAMPHVLAALDGMERLTPDQFCDLLRSLGFTDLTNLD